jgi:PAS domain S-box-containing protein
MPAPFFILALTNDTHHLMWQYAAIDNSGRAPAMVFDRGTVFWLFVGYTYLILLVCTVLTGISFVRAAGLYKKQLSIILAGVCLPWLVNILYVVDLDLLHHLDLTPFSLSISGLLFLYGLIAYQQLGLIPMARQIIQENMSDVIISVDLEERILDVNRSGRVLFHLENIIPAHAALEETIPAIYKLLSRYKMLSPVDTEVELTAFGDKRYWNFRLSRMDDHKEKQIGWLIMLKDITDRKEAEIALKESEKIHRIMLETSPNPIIYYNELGLVTYINPAFTRVFGWHLDEVLGRRIDFIPQECLEETKTALRKTIENPGGNYDFVTRRRTKSGDILDVSINSAVHRSKDGQTASTVVNFTDITKIKQTEQELRNTREFIRSIIDFMPSMLIGVDHNGVITHWNKEAALMTKIDTLESTGRPLDTVLPQILPFVESVLKIPAKVKSIKFPGSAWCWGMRRD